MKRELGKDIPKSQEPEFEDQDNLEEKLIRNRERNREHAKRTRLRKKEMIEGMKMRLLELQREAIRLEQLIEESSTATILLGLGSKEGDKENPQSMDVLNMDEVKEARSFLTSKGNIIDQLRQKVRMDAAKLFKEKLPPLSFPSKTEDSSNHDAETTTAESHSSHQDDFDDDEDDEEHNLHTYSATFQNGKPISDGEPNTIIDLDDIEAQKKERNRIHAKLTRDRKKLFTNQMQKAIETLEKHNQILKNQLDSVFKVADPAKAVEIPVDAKINDVSVKAKYSSPVYPTLVMPPHSNGGFIAPFIPHPMFAFDPHVPHFQMLPPPASAAAGNKSGAPSTGPPPGFPVVGMEYFPYWARSYPPGLRGYPPMMPGRPSSEILTGGDGIPQPALKKASKMK